MTGKKTEERSLNIPCMIHDIFKNIWIAAAVGISAAFLVYVGAKIQYTPSYTSKTTFVVSTSSGESAVANAEAANSMVDTFKSVLDSQVLKKEVCKEMDLKTFPGEINVSVVKNTNLITLKMTAEKPELAFELLKNVLRVYPEVGKKVLGNVVLDILEEPQYPSTPDAPIHMMDIMSKVFGIIFILIIILLALFSYLKEAVKSENEVDEKLDTTLIGVVQHEKQYTNLKSMLHKTKKKILFTDPFVSFGYREQIKRLCTKIVHKMQKENLKVILVTSAMEREGKSTVAMNLAQALGQRFDKVLLIDGNVKGTGLKECMKLDINEDSEWVKHIHDKELLQKDILMPEGYKFHVLLNGQVLEDSNDILVSEDLPKRIEELKKEMDVIIIDGPQVYKHSDTEILAKLSDASLLVVKQNDTSTRYINDAIDMLEEYNKGVLGCIFNDVYGSVGISSGNYGYGYGYSYGYSKYGKYGKYGKYKSVSDEKSEN